MSNEAGLGVTLGQLFAAMGGTAAVTGLAGWLGTQWVKARENNRADSRENRSDVVALLREQLTKAEDEIVQMKALLAEAGKRVTAISDRAREFELRLIRQEAELKAVTLLLETLEKRYQEKELIIAALKREKT
ncbi:MAG: hypothetical protein ABJN69_13070 [Hellea sp.]